MVSNLAVEEHVVHTAPAHVKVGVTQRPHEHTQDLFLAVESFLMLMLHID